MARRAGDRESDRSYDGARLARRELERC